MIYPDALHYRAVGGYISGCPDLEGVSTAAVPSRGVLAELLDRLGDGKVSALATSDTTYRPMILGGRDWARFASVTPARLVISRLASSGYEPLAARCGATTLSHLWPGQLCNGRSPFLKGNQCLSPALAAQVLLLNRRGRWLVVYTYN